MANLRFIDVRTAVLMSVILAACGCQTAQKPVSLLPPGSAPSLQPTLPAPVSSLASQARPQTQKDASAEPASTEANTPPQSSKSPQSVASDPVADLIVLAEREYQEGVANYHAGNSVSAKQNFDNALNALLSSNLDIRSDDRLQKEFDHIVEGVNQLYPGGTAADAEQAQDTQQKSEPAPIDVTNEMTPAADAGVAAKARAEIKNTRSDLPLMMTDQVAGYITYFSGYGRGVFERAYARSGRYHDMMVATLKEQGLPQDLIYLAQAESGFHPQAVSKAGARGIWQFMASRGIGYGLHHNMWVDDRQDPEKSTRAAARHLKDLYNQFGDWYLAMAAYNSGPGTVQAAVKRTGYADFWELYNRNVLPKETKNYVPIILAVTIMAKNPSQYGLDSVAMEHALEYDTVSIRYPVDLRLVAECVNSTPEELQDLNPSLLRLTTPREGQFDLHLPVGTKDQYETAIASIPADMRLWWRYHTVHSGDTLATLARTYHVTAKSITEANHLDGPELEADAKLVIPIAPGKHPLNDTATYARRITRYKVHAGDTVETVADNFGVSPQMLRRWNGIRGNSLSGRRIIALHLPVSPSAHPTEVASARVKAKHPAAAAKPAETATVKPPATKSAQIERLQVSRLNTKDVVHHKVKSGETLYSIANAYRTTVAALKRDNRNVAVIRPGMILTVQLTR
ncbi:MAG: LysM peptidoglycan-binding domain-containing protein [Candidatus Sulfotelmatobacter sp.]